MDACCAKFGYPLYCRLRWLAAAPVRVWRGIHVGGHQFAANLLDLPEGRYWSRLSGANIARLINREVPVAELRL